MLLYIILNHKHGTAALKSGFQKWPELITLCNINSILTDDAKTGFKPILTTKAISATDSVHQAVAGAYRRAGEQDRGRTRDKSSVGGRGGKGSAGGFEHRRRGARTNLQRRGG